MFHKEEFTGQGEGRKQEQKTRRHHPMHTHTVKSSKDVFTVSQFSSLKRKLQSCLSKETRVKKQKPFRSSHCLILLVGRGWLRQWGAAADFGKGRIQTSQGSARCCWNSQQNIRGRKGRKGDISAGQSPFFQTCSLMRNTDRRGKEMSKQHNLEEQSLP